jgi:hypothetical protein
MTRPANHHTISAGGLAFRMCLYFAHNPDEELYTNDVAAKFREVPRNLTTSLRHAVRGGWLTKESRGPGRGNQIKYTAGPRLLTLIGAP